jgi:hypothetical protein
VIASVEVVKFVEGVVIENEDCVAVGRLSLLCLFLLHVVTAPNDQSSHHVKSYFRQISFVTMPVRKVKPLRRDDSFFLTGVDAELDSKPVKPRRTKPLALVDRQFELEPVKPPPNMKALPNVRQ